MAHGGPFTITAVQAGRRWVSEWPVPLGKVVFEHLLEPVGGLAGNADLIFARSG